jgi:hypothetical protein
MSEGSERLAADLQVETLKGAERALAEEAIRIKARLDTLDRWISGDEETWFELANRLGRDVDLTINAPLTEARQQALAMRAVLSELVKLQGSQDQPAEPPRSATDEIRKKREERRARLGGEP